MHVTRVEISGLPPLGGSGDDYRFSFDCDERVNLLIGHNASGKTTVLRAMNVFGPDFALVGQEGSILCRFSGPGGRGQEVVMSVSGDWPRSGDARLDSPHDAAEPGGANPLAVPVFYVPSVRTGLAGRNIFRLQRGDLFRHPEVAAVLQDLRVRTLDGLMDAHLMLALREAVDRVIYEAVGDVLGYVYDDYGELIDSRGVDLDDPSRSGISPMDALFDTSSGVFHGQNVELAIEWLRRTVPDRGDRSQVARALDIGYSCARSICPEILVGEASHPHAVDRSEVSHPFVEDGGSVHLGMGIGTSDDVLGDALYAGVLSSGTQGTLLWIYALALRMASHHGWASGWEGMPAILLIDEVENHLHPVWQRRVIPRLLEHFPGLQVFATTHSPFVVAGLRAGQVHLLQRDDRGRVGISTGDRDVIGWSMDEILRTFMGVDEPTDQSTVDRAVRLRELRQRGSLSEEEAQEMTFLRRRVNEDFLNRQGPMDAERERYSALIQRFLAAEQSDLTQDGR